MGWEIETAECALTRRQLQGALVALQRDHMAASVVVSWLGMLYFLAYEGGVSLAGLGQALHHWWPLALALVAAQASILWLKPMLALRSPFYRAQLGAARYRFDRQGMTAYLANGGQITRPFESLRGAEWVDDELLAVRQVNGLFLVIPRACFPDSASLVMLEERLDRDPDVVSSSSTLPRGLAGRLIINLRAGLYTLLPRPTPPSGFSVYSEQVPLLALVALVLGLLLGRLTLDGPVELNAFAFEQEASAVLALLLGAFLAARLLGSSTLFLPLAILLLCLEPFFLLLSYAADWAAQGMAPGGLAARLLYLLVFVWLLGAWLRGLRTLAPERPRRTAGALLVLFCVAILPFWWLPEQDFWYPAYDAESSRPAIDVEKVYYAQPDLLRAALADLEPERPGEVDLYFLGFGGFGAENVFRREVQHARRIVDQRLDTRGRSLVLINHRNTLSDTPIASVSNLRLALQGMARKMRPEEDVLFLYLTSHGSAQELSVFLGPMGLNDLTPTKLRRMLDESGIRWRVVVVSACHSGGFIEALKDERTLVMTAAAQDRESFGCSNENEYTYFGEALFRNALARTHSFPEAFALTREHIAARERAERRPPSRPQLWMGSAIGERLAALAQRLDGLPTAAASPCPETSRGTATHAGKVGDLECATPGVASGPSAAGPLARTNR